MLFGLVGRKFKVDVAFASECGLVRKENQDHVVADPKALVFCVADGMGGGEAGGEASDIVCRNVSAVLHDYASFADRVRLVDDAIHRADGEIRAISAAAGYRQMGSTAAVLVSDGRRIAAVGNVGDSRVYRLRDGGLVQLTRDHTIVRELNLQTAGRAVAAGLRDRSLAISHMLTRALGVQEEAAPEWRRIDVRRDDVFLVCTDGLYDAASEADIRGALAAGGAAKEIAARLARLAVAGGAGDNYSLVVVKIGGRR